MGKQNENRNNRDRKQMNANTMLIAKNGNMPPKKSYCECYILVRQNFINKLCTILSYNYIFTEITNLLLKY